MNPFDRFWVAYPRKIGKGAARKAWASAIKKAEADDIIAAVDAFALSVRGEDRKFVAYPATWLNAERWEDEFPGEFGPGPAPINLTQRFEGVPEGITFDVWLRDHASPDEVEKARRFGVGHTLEAAP
jgi:hypothetical protein